MGLFGKKTDEQIKAENKIEELCGGFLGNDRFKNKLEKNNLDESTSNIYYKSILKNEIKNKTLNYEGIEYVYGVVVNALDLYGAACAYLRYKVVDKQSNIALPLA